MVTNAQRKPDGRDMGNRVLERCYVCAKELSDDEALIVVDYDPVDFLEGPGVLKGYEIRCEACLGLLPECPVCEGSNERVPDMWGALLPQACGGVHRQRRRPDHAYGSVTVRFLRSDTGRDCRLR